MLKKTKKTSTMELLLRRLANFYGIEPHYQDGTGKHHTVPLLTLQKLLLSMGVQASGPSEVKRALNDAKLSHWQKIVDDVLVVYLSRKPQSFFITLPIGKQSLEQVRIEGVFKGEHTKRRIFRSQGNRCQVVGSKSISGVRHVRIALDYPRNMVLGYYLLTVKALIGEGVIEGNAFVIVAPRQCYLPSRPRRSWGITVQLYGLRSQRNWGMGDLNDLKEVVTWAGETLQAGTVGVSPLHAPTPGVISPYSPSSRLFLNPLYLNVECMPDFQNMLKLRSQVGAEGFQADLEMLRKAVLINYEKVMVLKWPMFESLFKKFQERHAKLKPDRSQAFNRYIQREGRLLERFSLFQVLTEHFGSSAWRHWPKEFQNPDSAEVEKFRKDHKERIQFFQYLQWQCEEQLQEVHQAARRVKMPFGLYLDLPVGIHPDGSDAWMFNQELAEGFTIGAPPDSFNLHGQNWGLLAPLPTKMRASRYQFFIETLRHNMRHGGILRIDHALGLFRLYVIPDGANGAEGAYVRFPVNELLAIVALESVKNRVVVVGEDLGTVTPMIKKRLADAGILSYRLLLFEKRRSGSFRPPDLYPENCVVSVTTHDLPTLRGFWVGRDIELKEQIAVYASSKDAEAEWQHRVQDRVALMRALKKENLLPFKALHPIPLEVSKELCRAAYAYLAHTPSRLLVIPMEDLLGELEATNFPGIPENAYPSWRIKISRNIEELGDDSHICHFAVDMNRLR